MGSQGGWGQSKEFLELVKSIGEARSKAEEDRIILREIKTLKRRIAEPDVPRRKMKEYLIRLVYVEMLGHNASFGYIHAVQMTHDDSLLKRTVFLTVTLFLNEDHDLIILIVNTIQKDLLLLLLLKEGKRQQDPISSPSGTAAVSSTTATASSGSHDGPQQQQPWQLPVQSASLHGGHIPNSQGGSSV